MIRSKSETSSNVAEGAIYVGRPADLELPDALRKREYCNVIGPRQIGKTSLCQRVVRRLRNEGTPCAMVDLSSLRGVEDADGWYFAIIDRVSRELNLPGAVDWWDDSQRRQLPAVERWSLYMRTVVAARESGAVIFLDEVQSIAGGPSAGLLAAVRALHQAREVDESLRSLAFCLVGVVAPSALIEDDMAAEFNIGVDIKLEDFTRQEMSMLRISLMGGEANADVLLDAVYAWTEGHPYMAVRLCSALAKNKPAAGHERDAVDALVRELFLARPLEDTCLAYTNKRLRSRRAAGAASAGDRVELHQRLLQGGSVEVRAEDDVQLELRLSGLVKSARGAEGVVLRLRNPIFAQVYNEDWIRANSRSRFLDEAL